MAGYALQGDEGREIAFVRAKMWIKASSEQTDGAFSLVEALDPMETPKHVHDREDEAFYILGGEHEFECGDESFRLGPGGYVFLPRGIPHAHRRLGDPSESRMLIMVSPPGFETFFVELSEARDAGRELDAAFYEDLAKKYGIHWL
jgi:mannose-6-phosphate isomerase-like protein (cupin superfamily)